MPEPPQVSANGEHDAGAPDPRPSWGLAPAWLARLGVRSWQYVGVVVWAAIVYGALAAISGLVLPLLVAAVLGVLLSPLVSALARAREIRAVSQAWW